jgi:glutamate/aspartate transport system permease protein
MLDGIVTTIEISILAWIIALWLGVTIGVLRVLPSRWVRFVGSAYVEVIRNVPLLVQFFFWYFAMPQLLPRPFREWLYDNVENIGFWTAIVALGIYTASRVAEHIRSGLFSIPEQQYEAPLATGLTVGQMYRYVIIPYAIRVVMPPLTTEFLTVFKNSALAMTITVLETTGAAYLIDSYTFHGLEATSGACIVYIFTTISVVVFMGWLEKKISVPGLIVRGR